MSTGTNAPDFSSHPIGSSFSSFACILLTDVFTIYEDDDAEYFTKVYFGEENRRSEDYLCNLLHLPMKRRIFQKGTIIFEKPLDSVHAIW